MARGQAVDEDRTAELLHRSGGNPFFLEELVREGTAIDRGGRLPETVHELLQARIDALPPEASTTLQVAAVIGTEFGTRMLAAVEPVGDLDAALTALVRDDLIVPRGGDADDRQYAMRHPLVHEVAYRSLLIARRKVLHGGSASGWRPMTARRRWRRSRPTTATATTWIVLAASFRSPPSGP